MMNSATGNSKTILLVEDEAFVRNVTCEILRAAGYKVPSATNAPEAESIFCGWEDEIALLITDVVLPGENGRVLVQRLRQVSPSLVVLFMTGYAEQMGVGPSHKWSWLEKPFSAAVLLRHVESLLWHPDLTFGDGHIPTMPACGNATPGEYVQERQAAARFG
jgi:CheY-like chemotaxis protein